MKASTVCKIACTAALAIAVAVLAAVDRQIVHERAVSPADLKVGMVLSRDLISREGALLLSAERALDVALIRQIQDYVRRENHAVVPYIHTDPSGEKRDEPHPDRILFYRNCRIRCIL